VRRTFLGRGSGDGERDIVMVLTGVWDSWIGKSCML
jgi:hypothetical protein